MKALYVKCFARLLARLYPREWRARYGREFDGLLEDMDLTGLDLVGLVQGALQTYRKSRGENCAMEEQLALSQVVGVERREVPHGYEMETVMEYSRSDGSKTTVRRFFREVDFGDTYVNLQHLTRGSEPAQTIIVSGTKGEVDGAFRTDRTEMLVLHADGTVSRSEQIVKTWVTAEPIREKLLEDYRRALASGQSTTDYYRERFRLAYPTRELPAL